MSGGHGDTDKKCGFWELIIFCLALVAGTGCSLTSKLLLDMHSIGMTGEKEKFEKPLFQTAAMFVGMLAALVMHFIVLQFKIPFPGYKFNSKKMSSQGTTNTYLSIPNEDGLGEEEHDSTKIPCWMYFVLVIPAIFDLIATALCMFGLMYVNVSIYQMLRGSAIVFVALLKQFALKDKLQGFKWVGVGWNCVSIVLVGCTALLDAGSTSENEKAGQAGLGVFLILCGALVQSLQYAFEEKVMSMDISAPPLLLIGMEGFWGFFFCMTILYPVAYYIPGNDHGSYENGYNTWVMLNNDAELKTVFTLYFFSIFFYNMLACLVTFMLNSVWHAILDNFRPITVWAVDLGIFYLITTSFGEAWTKWSFMQLLGMFVLLYGTAIYNAPNAGSIKLEGDCKSCFLDFSREYRELENSGAAAGGLYSPYMSPFQGRSPANKR